MHRVANNADSNNNEFLSILNAVFARPKPYMSEQHNRIIYIPSMQNQNSRVRWIFLWWKSFCSGQNKWNITNDIWPYFCMILTESKLLTIKRRKKINSIQTKRKKHMPIYLTLTLQRPSRKCRPSTINFIDEFLDA